MNNHDAVIKGIIPAHTREEKDALIEHLRAQLAEAREVIQFVSDRENLTFAECTDAEEIIGACRAYLEKYK